MIVPGLFPTPRRAALNPFVAAIAASLLVAGIPRAAHPQVFDILSNAGYSEQARADGSTGDFKIDRTEPGDVAAAVMPPVTGRGLSFALTENALNLAGLEAFAGGDVRNAGVESAAGIGFWLEAVEISPPSGFVGTVPLDVSGALSVSASATGSSSNGADMSVVASASITFFPRQVSERAECVSGGSCIVILSGAESDHVGSVPYSFQVGLAPFQPEMASLSVAGSAGLTGGLNPGDVLNGSYTAFADPTIVIDPNFRFKDDFQLIFSPNVFAGPSGIPEPATFSMIVVGIGALVLARWRWRLRAPNKLFAVCRGSEKE